MAHRNLAAFLKALEDDGELVRIGARVSPRLEIAEIADRAVKGGRPGAALRKRRGVDLSGRDQRVRVSQAGCSRRWSIESWQEWDERLEFFLDPKPPEGILEKLKAIPKVTELAGVFPKTVRSGPCQEVVATGDAVDPRRCRS